MSESSAGKKGKLSVRQESSLHFVPLSLDFRRLSFKLQQVVGHT